MREISSTSILIAFISGSLIQAQGPVTEAVLYNFGSPPTGVNPQAGVIRDAAGNLYGTTESGGSPGFGTVYKISPSGQETVLYRFTGGADGANPMAGVIADGGGNLYGTTLSGGASGNGTVYKIDSTGQETVVYSFKGNPDGANPRAGVILDAQGNLYGTTASGGGSNSGTVYKIDPGGQESVLHRFTEGSDGSEPHAGVIRDAAGNLYGTTLAGGPSNSGTVYKVDASGQETVIYRFTGGSDGANPQAGLIRDAAGNLYGTTGGGGAQNSGTVFRIDSSGSETVLHSFTTAEGSAPNAGVISDGGGNLYGTTVAGGSSGSGTVFKVDALGQATVLYNFRGDAENDGRAPVAGVIRDATGNLYGTTSSGGPSDAGTVYKLDPTGQETVLHAFNPLIPSNPFAGVIRDGSGNLYGTTYNGGASGKGTVYKIDSSGRRTVLYAFTGGTDGAHPYAGVAADAEGNLYGTTYYGGASGNGTVYKIDSAGHETVLHSFLSHGDGANPYAGVTIDAAGDLYGTTVNGGALGNGTVYKINIAGQTTVLHAFTGGADGGNPYAGVISDAAGDLYGTTVGGGLSNSGTVYKIDISGQETVLHSFANKPDGRYPHGGVIRDADGNFFGTTQAGGTYDEGTVYKIDTAGQETVLHSFTGNGDGRFPYAGVIRDGAGNLYGTTQAGGVANHGTVYEFKATGVEKVLYSFRGGIDGDSPYGALIGDGSGHLFGTTIDGGGRAGGTVFEILPNP